MIASFQNNFIFIKTRKTAGTSVEIVLSQVCGSNDIITPVSYDDEKLRETAGAVAARNFADAELEVAVRTAAAEGKRDKYNDLMRRLKRAGGYYNHMRAARVHQNLPADFWDKAFKFTIERHPYEKVVSSAYFHLTNRRLGPDKLPSLLEATVRRGKYDDSKIYTIDGKVAVDRILRHETLSTDLADVGKQLGFIVPPLPRAKGMARQDRRPAREILTTDQMRTIYETTRSTFDLLGYEP